MTNPKVASSSSGTISRRPIIDGLEGLTPGAAGDAVWLGRRRVDGTLARAIILDDPRLSEEFEDQLAAHADLLRLAGLHPRSVTFLGIERLNTGHRVLVTEHHPLGTLDRVLRTGKAPWPEVAAIGLQLASALAFAHARGVRHGRINPGSVHLGQDQTALLGGFAIIGDIEEQLDLAPSPLSYVAPEGGNEASADVYSLAATLFAAGTGHVPGARPTWSSVAPALRPVLQAALAAAPENRPTASELVDILTPLAPQAAECLAAAPAIELPKAPKTTRTRSSRSRRDRSGSPPRGGLLRRMPGFKVPRKVFLVAGLALGVIGAAGVLSHFHASDPLGVGPASIDQPRTIEPPTSAATPKATAVVVANPQPGGQITPLAPQSNTASVVAGRAPH